MKSYINQKGQNVLQVKCYNLTCSSTSSSIYQWNACDFNHKTEQLS